LVALVAKSVTVHGFKGFPLTAGFKGCILITVRYFVSALYGKTARFYFPTNPPALSEPQWWRAGPKHGTWRWCGKPRIAYEHFGDPISVFSLTLNPERLPKFLINPFIILGDGFVNEIFNLKKMVDNIKINGIMSKIFQ